MGRFLRGLTVLLLAVVAMSGTAVASEPPANSHVTVTYTLTAMQGVEGLYVGPVALDLLATPGTNPLLAFEYSIDAPDQWQLVPGRIVIAGVHIVHWRAVELDLATGQRCIHTGAIVVSGACRLFLTEPVNSDGSSVFNAGSTIPVKFELSDLSGMPIEGMTPVFSARKIDSSVQGTQAEAAPLGLLPSQDGDFDESTGGRYSYNWCTKGLDPGTYELSMWLGDGVSRTVRVSLK